MIANFGCQNASAARCLSSLRQKSTRTLMAVVALIALLCGVGASAHAQSPFYDGGIKSTVTSALPGPMGVTTDSSGNVFVASNDSATETATVYEIPYTPGTGYGAPTALPAPTGGFPCPPAISEGNPCLRGLAVDHNGYLWVAAFGDEPTTAGQVYVYSSGLSAAPAAVGTALWQSPWGVTADASGNVFVSDNGASTITEITNGATPTPTIAVVYTYVSGGLQNPRGLAIDANADLFVIDGNVQQLKELPGPGPTYSTVNTVSGGFQGPGDLAIGAHGNLWLSEYQTGAVRELIGWDAGTTSFSSVLSWGDGSGTPVSVWHDATTGNLLVTDFDHHAVQQIALQPVSFGSVSFGSSSAHTLTFTVPGTTTTFAPQPVVVTQGASGADFAASGNWNCTVFNGNTICTVSVNFTPKAPGLRMGAVEMQDTSGNLMAAASFSGIGTGPEVVFSPSATPSPFTGLGSGTQPQKIAIDGAGNIFVADANSGAIFKIAAGGTSASAIVTGLNVPYGIAIDGAGDLFVSEAGSGGPGPGIIEITAASNYTSAVQLASAYPFSGPLGLAFDASGNLYVADANSANQVLELTWSSGYSDVKTVSSSFGKPFDVAVDVSGNIWVADAGDSGSHSPAVYQLSPGGTITGTYSGFTYPESIAVDPAGNVYVADNKGATITELVAPGYSSSVALASGLSDPAGVALDSTGNVYYTTNASDDSLYEINRVTPPPLTFGSSAYQTQSSDSPQSVTVDNIGNADLTFSGFTFTPDFALDSSATCSTTSPVTSGNSCALGVDFTPQSVGSISGTATLTDNNLGATNASQIVNLNGTGTKATPTITWSAPASISYPTDLSGVLNATVSCGSSCGTFAYTSQQGANPPQAVTASTVLAPGVYSLTVNFAPTDTTDFDTPTAVTVSLTVNKSTLTMTWPTASSITYGQTLASSTLTGGTALNGSTNVPGNFAFTTPSTAPNAGTDSESVTFTPTDTNYDPVTGSVNVVVNKATPNVTWPAASDLTYGQALSSSTLTGGSAVSGSTSVPGHFDFTTPTTIPNAGTDAESVTFTPTDAANYASVTSTVDVVVSKATPTMTWPTASAITYGQTLASSTLTGGSAANGSTSVLGNFAFTTPTTSPSVGTAAQSVTFTPTDTANYNPVTGTVSVTVNKATPTITWPTASGITYGQTLASSTLTGGSALNGATNVPGNFAFTTPSTAPNAGTDSESVTFTPTDGANYNSVTATVSVVVSKATPTVTWPTASGITYGQTLASSTLTGGSAVSGSTSVGGNFAFTTPSTAPNAGTDSESVTFTPTDGANYNPVTSTVNVVVSKATPTMTWPTASAITYGQTLASSTLTGGSAANGSTSVLGNFAFTTPTTAPSVGTAAQSVTFTPTDGANYSPVTGTVNVTVNKATPTLTWPTASAIVYGQTLASSTLTGGSALNGSTSVLGSFAFTNPATLPAAGTHAESVTFTPTDTANYSPVTGMVNVTVSKATPTITWPAASAIVYGQTLASSTLTGGSAVSGSTNVGGNFAFTTPATAPPAGIHTESVNFTPTDAADYNPVSGTVNVTVTQATSTITWSAPASILYGTALSAAQLDATANVPGTFTYTPSAGTILPVGAGQMLSVTFNPTDATNYQPATATTTITVAASGLTVSAINATRVYGTANPTFTGTITGAQNGDSFTESFATPATITSNAGTYAIVPSASGAHLSNYTVVIHNGTLTITKAGSSTALSASGSSVNPGSSVTLTATVASATSGTPTGSVSFYDGATLLGTGTLSAGVASYSTTALGAGASHTLTAVYSGDVNFNTSSTTGSTTISVGLLDFSLGAPTPGSQTGQSGTAFTYSFSITPTYGAYQDTVNFAATGLPAGASASFAPASIPANGGPQTVTMIVTTAPNTVGALHPMSTGRHLVPLAFALFLLPLAGTKRMRRQGRWLGKIGCLLLLILGGLGATAALTGCGSHTGFSTPQGYTITVTASSGAVQHSTSVTLNLQ